MGKLSFGLCGRGRLRRAFREYRFGVSSKLRIYCIDGDYGSRVVRSYRSRELAFGNFS